MDCFSCSTEVSNLPLVDQTGPFSPNISPGYVSGCSQIQCCTQFGFLVLSLHLHLLYVLELGSCLYWQMLCPFFLNSTCQVGKLQGHSWFPYSCAVLISSFKPQLSLDSTAKLMWLPLPTAGQSVPEGSAVLQSRPCAVRSCPARSSWTRAQVPCGSSGRSCAGAAGILHCLREGFQHRGFQAGDTSWCQSTLVPLALHREWWEGEGTEPLCELAVTGSGTALLVLALLLLMAFACEGLVGMWGAVLVHPGFVKWGCSPVYGEAGFIRKSWAL